MTENGKSDPIGGAIDAVIRFCLENKLIVSLLLVEIVTVSSVSILMVMYLSTWLATAGRFMVLLPPDPDVMMTRS